VKCRNPSLVRNLAVLRAQGVTIVEPESGRLACGTEGIGRFSDPDTIIDAVASILTPRDLAGVNILVTAGPTREPIDAVRFLSNPSTGRMGYAIARSARNHGAQVILVSGPTRLEPPDGVTLVPVTTAAEMKQAVNGYAGRCSVIIMTAAVSDFRPVTAHDRKVRKEDVALTLQLERTDDILQDLGSEKGGRVLVGFAAETDAVTQNALQKLRKKNLDLIVANDVRRKDAGFGSAMNAVTIIERSGTATELPLMPKDKIAELIIQKVAQLAAKQRISP
jgi:phosphopantothenoylcysteine decarboxylase/phosphopantothenate--cysteine ligase